MLTLLDKRGGIYYVVSLSGGVAVAVVVVDKLIYSQRWGIMVRYYIHSTYLVDRGKYNVPYAVESRISMKGKSIPGKRGRLRLREKVPP